MKRIIFIFSMFLLSFTLFACGGPDTERPVLSGVEDKTIFVGEAFDPLAGVSAIDNVDGDITQNIRISGNYDVNTIGSYFLRYVIEDAAGNRTEATRYLNVIFDTSLLGEGMVANGDFSLGWVAWETTTGLEGGRANYSVVDGELKVEILSVASGLWEPRLENNGIEFKQGVIYEVSFDARADAPRAINVQVGELIPAAPWFVNFKPTTPFIADLSTTMQTFKFTFRMDLETNPNGSLLFEMGTVPGTVGVENLLTNVYLDNVEIREVDELIDITAPVISGAADVRIEIGSDFDPLEGVTVEDNVDGVIELTSANVSGTVDTDTEGDYVLTYTVKDAAGNEAVVTRTVTVMPAAVIDLSGEPTYGWRAFINSWEGGAGELSVVDEALVLEVTAINAMNASWKIQVIQDAYAMGTGPDNAGSIQLEAGKTYRLSFDAKATTAGDVVIAIGHAVGNWTPYFEKDVAITTEMASYEVEFTLDADGNYETLAQLKFELGKLLEGTTAPQSFTLDNVIIEILENNEFVDAELIVNGDFSPRDASLTTGWRTFLNTWEGTSGSLSARNGELTLTLDSMGALTDNWKVQIIQDAFALGIGPDNAGSLQFEAGKTYRVSFDARASVAGEVNIAIGHAVGNWTPYFTKIEEVTTEMSTITVEFTLDADRDYSTPAQFKLEFGKMFQGLSGPQTFTVANVSIEVLNAEDEFENANLIVNGKFE